MTNTAGKNEHLHDGHRSRMRAKLMNYGERVLETHELFEMLLYTPIRYRDTNPATKRLFKEYKTLDRIFSAPPKALVSIEGIGERTAEFICEIGKSLDNLDVAYNADTSPIFDDFECTGRFLVDYFDDKTDSEVVMLLLDNKFSLVNKVVIYGGDYGSAGVKPKDFVSKALQYNASTVIIAHNHPYGPHIISEADLVTNRMVSEALAAAGVFLAESYLVCGSIFVGMMGTNKYKAFLQSPDMARFFESRGNPIPFLRSVPTSGRAVASTVREDTDIHSYLSSILSYSNKPDKAKDISEKLLKRFGTLREIFSVSTDELVRCSGMKEQDAVYFKIIAHLCTRRIVERFEGARTHNEEDFRSYVKAMFIGKQTEQVYAFFFNADDKFITKEFLSDGTVNSSGIVPRRLVELALRHKAARVILAHNHPQGTTTPSNEDVMLTSVLENAFSSLGIRLEKHYIVVGDLCDPIS